jgi:hypothetical protein
MRFLIALLLVSFFSITPLNAETALAVTDPVAPINWAEWVESERSECDLNSRNCDMFNMPDDMLDDGGGPDNPGDE